MDVIKELQDIRKELKKADAELMQKMGKDGKKPITVLRSVNPSEVPDKIIETPEDLFNTVKSTIRSVEDANKARLYWTVPNLLKFEQESRTVICTALIQRFTDMGLRPQELWNKVIKDPAFFNEWAEDMYGEDKLPVGQLNEPAGPEAAPAPAATPAKEEGEF